MRILIRLGICAAIAFNVSRQPAVPQPAIAQEVVATKCSTKNPAFARIYSGYEIGSGSLIASNIIATNHHVVKAVIENPDTKLYVRFAGAADAVMGVVVGYNKPRDIALVKVELPQPRATMKLAAVAPKPNTLVCAIGNPRATTRTTKGKFAGMRGRDFKSAIAIRPGYSGGPLLNQVGEMIAVNKSIWLDVNGKPINIGFATPIAEVIELAKKNNVELH